MNVYAGSAHASENEKILCARLKAKFADRGASAVLGKNVPTSELMQKIGKGVNPFDFTAETPRARQNTAQVRLANERTATAPRTVNTVKAQPIQNAAVKQRATVKAASSASTEYAWDGSYARAYARGAQIRAKAAQIRADKARISRIASSVRTAPAVKAEPQKRMGIIESVKSGLRERSADKAMREAYEVKTKAAPFPIEIIVLLSVCTLAIMLVIYTIAQIYSFSSEISDLKDKQNELAKTESALQVKLNERDDIRVIERIAVDQIGMVKNEAVDRNHISISVGDKIDIAEEEKVESNGFFSTLLSVIGGGFSKAHD